MAVQPDQVAVGTTATELTTAPTDTVAGQSLAIRNKGTASVYLGGAGVTTGNGFELAAGESLSVDLAEGERLYAIAASGTVPVHVLRTGV